MKRMEGGTSEPAPRPAQAGYDLSDSGTRCPNVVLISGAPTTIVTDVHSSPTAPVLHPVGGDALFAPLPQRPAFFYASNGIRVHISCGISDLLPLPAPFSKQHHAGRCNCPLRYHNGKKDPIGLQMCGQRQRIRQRNLQAPSIQQLRRGVPRRSQARRALDEQAAEGVTQISRSPRESPPIMRTWSHSTARFAPRFWTCTGSRP